MSSANGLPGAFGSGSTFAMEGGWILARTLELTRFASRLTRDALGIFGQIVSSESILCVKCASNALCLTLLFQPFAGISI
jgi:hypothetical protein